MMDSLDSTKPDNGKRYPDSVKELARELYGMVAGQNAAEVARLLRSGAYGDPVEVPRYTVAVWAKDDAWAAWHADRMRQIAPAIREQTAHELVLAAHDGGRFLRRVNRGAEDEPDLSDILADASLSPLDRKTLIDARIKAHALARKDRIAASIAAIDRAGLSPTGKNDPLAGGLAPLRPAANLADLTDEELAEHEARRGAGRRA